MNKHKNLNILQVKKINHYQKKSIFKSSRFLIIQSNNKYIVLMFFKRPQNFIKVQQTKCHNWQSVTKAVKKPQKICKFHYKVAEKKNIFFSWCLNEIHIFLQPSDRMCFSCNLMMKLGDIFLIIYENVFCNHLSKFTIYFMFEFSELWLTFFNFRK